VRAAFGGVHPDLTKITNLLQLDVPISRAAEPALQATIVGPKGELTPDLLKIFCATVSWPRTSNRLST